MGKYVFRVLYPAFWLVGERLYLPQSRSCCFACCPLFWSPPIAIRDRHVGQLFSLPAHSVSPPSAQRAEAAAYIVCYILIEAGYFVNIGKSQCVPSTVVRFLGFLCDSLRQSFLIPPDKKTKFRSLRESILSSSLVNLKTLQHFAGKVISFSLAIPGCKLYVREALAP